MVGRQARGLDAQAGVGAPALRERILPSPGNLSFSVKALRVAVAANHSWETPYVSV